MALKKLYLDIPGTTVFDADQARIGYHLNQFCMTLKIPTNRERFKAAEREYLDEWSMSEEQKIAVLARDYNRLVVLGGNIYFLSKLFFSDGHSVEYIASGMAGMSQQDYRAMMVAGGRSLKGNRYRGESA